MTNNISESINNTLKRLYKLSSGMRMDKLALLFMTTIAPDFVCENFKEREFNLNSIVVNSKNFMENKLLKM